MILSNILPFGKAWLGSKREATDTQSTQKGVTVTPRRVYANQGNAMSVTAFQRALDMRAKTFSRALLTVEQKRGGVWVPQVTDITGARDFRHLQYLFQVKPNEYMNAQQMWKLAQWYRFMEGCGAIWMPGGWQVAHSVYPVHNISWNQVTNTYYIYSDHLTQLYEVGANELILLRGAYRQGKPLGESLLDIARNTLGLYLTAEQFNVDTLAKGGTQKMFVSEQTAASPTQGLLGGLDDKEVNSAVEDVREQVANNDDVIFVQGDLKTEARSQSFQDLQISESRREANEALARVCGVYGALIGLTVNSVYKSMDEAWHAFIETTMRDDWEEVEQELNGKLLDEGNYDRIRFHFHTENVCIDSDHMKARTASARRTAGITTANEERAYLGLAAVEGGDELNKPTAPQPPKGGASDDTTGDNNTK